MQSLEKKILLSGLVREKLERSQSRGKGKIWRTNGTKARVYDLTARRGELRAIGVPFADALKTSQELQDSGRIRAYAYSPEEIRMWAAHEEWTAVCPPNLRVSFDRQGKVLHYGPHAIPVRGRLNAGLCAAICGLANPGQWVDETDILEEMFGEEDTLDRKYSRKLRDAGIRINRLTLSKIGRACFVQEGAKFRMNV